VEHAAALHAVHERGAARLKHLCEVNTGIYIKIGQHIGLMDYLLPWEYVAAMRGMYDKAPTSPFVDVERTFQEEFGRGPHEVFQHFDEVPIASASLAQVHTAFTHDGQKVAVKVQHRALREMARTEVPALEYLVYGVRYFFPSFGFQWLVDEVKGALPKELDFVLEGDNADRCRANAAHFGDKLVVPTVLRSMSSRRVLVMAFEDGVQMADSEALVALGLQPGDVAHLITEVISDQIFVHGFVHCDPHPGNCLVRPRVDASGTVTPQLVLLDHGLYRSLDEEVRLAYCNLWKSIVLADAEGIKVASEELGVHSPTLDAMHGPGLAHTLFAAMLTAKSWNKIIDQDMSSLEMSYGGSKAAAHKDDLSENVQRYLHGIIDVLETVPRDVLFLMKANDSLRSTAFRLKASATDTYVVAAKTCIRALSLPERACSLRQKCSLLLAWVRLTCFEFCQSFKLALSSSH